MAKEKKDPGQDKEVRRSAAPDTDKNKEKKLPVTEKLIEKLKKLRSKDPNIYPLW